VLVPANTTVQTALDLPLHGRGKVRDTYELGGGELLMVATDRISAFDVVLPTPIPDKGRVLTRLSAFWFQRTADIIPNHLAPPTPTPPPQAREGESWAALLGSLPDLGERALRVLRAEPIPFECVVRGYLSGSGWKDYQQTGEIAGERLPTGLRESDRLPEPIFTPATKAQAGHDENIARRQLADRLGTELAQRLEALSLALYRAAAAHAEARGLILADTKLEFGWRDGRLLLIDEAFTPDSSRYWDLARYRPGGPQPSYDKQFVRDYLETLAWDKQPPGPALPDEVVEGTRARYLEALERLTR